MSLSQGALSRSFGSGDDACTGQLRVAHVAAADPVRQKQQGASAPRLYFPTIVISDTHLFKKVAQAEMLLDFLQHVDCDRLIIDGDFLDGWKMEGKKHKKFPEMHMRVMDAINRKAVDGAEIVYLPGNHDEKLRTEKILNRTHRFVHPDTEENVDIRITDSFIYTDPQDRRFVVLHGDQFDPNRLSETGVGKKASVIGDAIYDGLIDINGIAIQLGKNGRAVIFHWPRT